jgi:hypothetical protein
MKEVAQMIAFQEKHLDGSDIPENENQSNDLLFSSFPFKPDNP